MYLRTNLGNNAFLEGFNKNDFAEENLKINENDEARLEFAKSTTIG